MASNVFESPIPLSELESALAWVDTFKLSRPTKKINRDFSDAVLLAEMLSVHYPKLVEMHNYPPRNSHALKLNNWMTLNRKVLKKLKLNLCVNTMEQLANSVPGVIERVLVMTRDKIRRDEELEKSSKDAEQNMSSGGSYYEACGDEEHVLVVPVKARVNGVLETLQQKVVSYDAYQAMKEELKDAKEAVESLKQKVDHLDNVIKVKDDRISDLQKDLERKQSRHKKFESLQNSLSVPFDDVPLPVVDSNPINLTNKFSGPFKIPSKQKLVETKDEFDVKDIKLPTPKVSSTKITPKSSITEVVSSDLINPGDEIDRINSNIFKEAKLVIEDIKPLELDEEFKDSEPGNVVTIEDIINKEISDISKPEEVEQIEVKKFVQSRNNTDLTSQ